MRRFGGFHKTQGHQTAFNVLRSSNDIFIPETHQTTACMVIIQVECGSTCLQLRSLDAYQEGKIKGLSGQTVQNIQSAQISWAQRSTSGCKSIEFAGFCLCSPTLYTSLTWRCPRTLVLFSLLGRTGLGDNLADSTHGYSCNSFLILYSRS